MLSGSRDFGLAAVFVGLLGGCPSKQPEDAPTPTTTQTASPPAPSSSVSEAATPEAPTALGDAGQDGSPSSGSVEPSPVPVGTPQPTASLALSASSPTNPVQPKAKVAPKSGPTEACQARCRAECQEVGMNHVDYCMRDCFRVVCK